jgi:hypothetical protein
LNHSKFLTLLGVEAYSVTGSRGVRLPGMTERGRRGQHPRNPPTWSSIHLWYGDNQVGWNAWRLGVPTYRELVIGNGFQVRDTCTEVLQNGEWEGDSIHLLRTALTCISLPQLEWSKGPQNVYGVSGTYKCGRCRKLHRKVVYIQTLVDMILEVCIRWPKP